MRRGRPRAHQGLITTDHSRRGRRCVTVLDPQSLAVSVLEPWEHGVLVLCDGKRDTATIAVLIGQVDGVTVDKAMVRSAIDFFARQQLVEFTQASPRGGTLPARGRSMADLQLAYEEWHKDPLRTSQILSARLDSPFVSASAMSAAPSEAPDEVVAEPVTTGSRLPGALMSGRGLLDAPPPASDEEDSPFFGDEPTENREPMARAETELLPASARPIAAARRQGTEKAASRLRCPRCFGEVAPRDVNCRACGGPLPTGRP